jgi:hypothetical protein
MFYIATLFSALLLEDEHNVVFTLIYLQYRILITIRCEIRYVFCVKIKKNNCASNITFIFFI